MSTVSSSCSIKSRLSEYTLIHYAAICLLQGCRPSLGMKMRDTRIMRRGCLLPKRSSLSGHATILITEVGSVRGKAMNGYHPRRPKNLYSSSKPTPTPSPFDQGALQLPFSLAQASLTFAISLLSSTKAPNDINRCAPSKGTHGVK